MAKIKRTARLSSVNKTTQGDDDGSNNNTGAKRKLQSSGSDSSSSDDTDESEEKTNTARAKLLHARKSLSPEPSGPNLGDSEQDDDNSTTNNVNNTGYVGTQITTGKQLADNPSLYSNSENNSDEEEEKSPGKQVMGHDLSNSNSSSDGSDDSSNSNSSSDGSDDSEAKTTVVVNTWRGKQLAHKCAWSNCTCPMVELLRCTELGCMSTLHRMCQTKWEGPGEITDEQPFGDFCPLHHPLRKRKYHSEEDNDDGSNNSTEPVKKLKQSSPGKQVMGNDNDSSGESSVDSSESSSSSSSDSSTSSVSDDESDLPFSDLNIRIVLLAFCLLHDVHDQQSHTSFPTSNACEFNIRHVAVSRINCVQNSMLHKLRNEKKGAVPSVTDGSYLVAFTSFQVEQTDNSLPMTSVTSCDKTVSHYAGPLTVPILLDAILWIKGRSWRKKYSTDDDAMKAVKKLISVEGEIDLTKGLIVYLRLLGNVIPPDLSPTELTEFINDHTWDSSITTVGEKDAAVASGDGYRLLRFILSNLAHHTKIVTHIADGSHRITTLVGGLVGYRFSANEDTTEINDYASNMPHSSTQKVIRFTIPNRFDVKLVQQMKRFSSDAQTSATMQVPHTLRDTLSNEMTKLHKKCDDAKIPCLCVCLDLLYKIIQSGESVMTADDWTCIKNGTLMGPQCDFE